MGGLQVLASFDSFTLTWHYFFGQLVAGLTLGSLYALLALGYSMVYGILKLLNFAHGEVFMIGSYIGYFVLTALGGAASPNVPAVLLILLMFGAAMIGSGVLGMTVERFAYRPLRRASRIAPLISALGVSFFLQQTATLLFGSVPKQYDTFSLNNGSLFNRITIGSFAIQYMQLIVILSAGALMVALIQLVSRTQVGRAMRATSYDLEAASMMGIDVDRVIVFTFFVGSALAGAGGVMNGLIFQNVNPYIGFNAGLKAFTAAVVGGIGSIPGAMFGGLAIGVAQALATGYLSSAYQDVIVFAILVVFMLVRPSGLFGAPALQKV
ncbi:MAG: branched-chain amino acid ABC transporter permease [Actinobacteria bacterium]|nr:MAG: branched-chain amino acid ABC transporter permease [Actinomycetota bacterium]